MGSGSHGPSSVSGIIQEANEELVLPPPASGDPRDDHEPRPPGGPFERGLLMLREGERLMPQVIRVPRTNRGRRSPSARRSPTASCRNQESILTSDALVDDRFRLGHSVEAQQLALGDVRAAVEQSRRHRPDLRRQPPPGRSVHRVEPASFDPPGERRRRQDRKREAVRARGGGRADGAGAAAGPGDPGSPAPTLGPPIPGYEVHGHSTPCQAVGGDYFDYMELPGGRYALALGDVAGRGCRRRF